MFENCNLLPTKDMGRTEWLEERRNGIGGSDAAAIAGLSSFATPYTVFLDKLGLLPEKEDSEAMRQGRDFEEYVAKRFTESTGKKVQRYNYMVSNPDYPFALADIDRRVVGENAGLECKTTSTLNLRQFHGVEFPERYYAQCLHYMAVTGADRWYLAVLVLGKEFHVFTLERDEAEIAALMSMEKIFWEKVEAREAPGITGAKADTEAVRTVFSDSCNEEADFFGMESLFARMSQLDELISDATEQKDEIINNIKLRMGQADRGFCGDYKVSWKATSRRTLDTKALKAAHPDLDFSQYMKESFYRPIRFTKISKEDE